MTCSEICKILRNFRKISEKLCKNSILFNIIQYYSIVSLAAPLLPSLVPLAVVARAVREGHPSPPVALPVGEPALVPVVLGAHRGAVPVFVAFEPKVWIEKIN